MRFWWSGVLLVLCGCGAPRPASVRIDPALATLVPAGTTLLVGIRMEALRATPLYQKLKPTITLAGSAAFGIEKAWEILIASDGRHTAILARGDFADRGLEPQLDLPRATRARYKGYEITANQSVAVCFLNPSTVVTGRPEAVRAILDQRGQSNGPPRGLREQIERIPPADQMWAVGAGFAAAGDVPAAGGLANLAQALQFVDTFRAGAIAGTGLTLSATASCRTAEDAESLAGALRVMSGLAKLGRDVRIEQTQRNVQIDASLPPEVVEKLAGNAR
jgi:hypothetical protein